MIKKTKHDPKKNTSDQESKDVDELSKKVNELKKKGLKGIVDDVPAYRTVAETEDLSGALQRLREEGADMITFTSGSTVQHFKELVTQGNIDLPGNLVSASIGPVTSFMMKELGMNVGIEAEQHDIPGLVEAILHYYQS